MDIKAKTVEEYLNSVDYRNNGGYVPSDFALELVNFIKLVNGGESENKTPAVHYRMLDNFVADNGMDTINLCHRGMAKSTLKEYLILYFAVFGELPGFGKIPYGIYVSDSMDNGVKKMRKALEFRYHNSAFLKTYIKEIKFTDIRWEFINASSVSLVFSGHGAKALSLDTIVHTDKGLSTIAKVQVGDKVYGSDGKLTDIVGKSEIFNRPMYRISLKDGRVLDVCEEHLNSVYVKDYKGTRKEVLTTKELLSVPLQLIRKRNLNTKKERTTKENLVYIECAKPVEYPTKNLLIDPYTLGVILGDGRIRKDCGSVELTGHIEDFPHYLANIPYVFGKYQIDSRNSNVRTQSIRGLGKILKDYGLNVHGNDKFIPTDYFYGDIEQRLALLQGLMDTDGTASERKINSVASFTSNSKKLADGITYLVNSLGGWTHTGRHSSGAYRVQIHLNMPIFKLPRKAARHKQNSATMVPIISIEKIADTPSQCIAVNNESHEFLVNDFVVTHNTGVRGTRENNSRPVIALLDDLISDEDARSATVISSIEDTVYKAIDYALHPKKRKIIWSGTPFNAKDPLYKAVESGAWNVNVYPVCEEFPCKKEDFRGSWEDRFDYEYVKRQYEKAVKAGKVDTFNQELMLRIMSDEDRMIQDVDIGWYTIDSVIKNKSKFNFYITTDFATSVQERSDFSVISVWAYNNVGDWLWVDGICARQLMNKNMDDLFRLAQMYRPQSVGIEVSGQQGGFIPWIQSQMLERNIYFPLASDSNNNAPGIRPNTNKMVRFNTVLPLFKARKIYFPIEKKTSTVLAEFMNELTLVAVGGFKSKHDDCLDTVSMLSLLQPWKPSEESAMKQTEDGMWETIDNVVEVDRRSSYII